VSTSNKPIKLTPLHTIAQRLGAQFTEQRRWRIPEVYTTLEDEITAAREGVVLADESPNGKLTIEGDGAESVLSAAFDVPTLAIGEGFNRIYRLRSNFFFISTPPGGETAARKKLTTTVEKSEQFVTVTDITHGWSEIRVIGPASQELLSKVCGLDFHPTAFPDGAAKQSSLVKTAQLIIRRDIDELPTFSIIGAQSLGAYIWDTMVEAGQEFGLLPIGRSALGMLEDSQTVG
jgi:sarcosine oxidase subunit alpha